MQPIIKFGITKDGIISILQTTVRYGPLFLWGIGIFDPIIIQIADQIDLLIKKLQEPTPSIPLICANISTTQLEAVWGGSILENY